MIKQLTANQQGFTLVEVMIAIAILSIGILTLITMQVTAIKGNSKASHISIATNHGADRLEQLFALDYDHPDFRDDGKWDNSPAAAPEPDGIAGLDDATPTTADGMDASDPNYTIYWNVADDTPMPDTKTIRVIILRQDAGATRTVTMNYLKSKFI